MEKKLELKEADELDKDASMKEWERKMAEDELSTAFSKVHAQSVMQPTLNPEAFNHLVHVGTRPHTYVHSKLSSGGKNNRKVTIKQTRMPIIFLVNVECVLTIMSSV